MTASSPVLTDVIDLSAGVDGVTGAGAGVWPIILGFNISSY
ncbi:MAG: hypothetical protein ACLRQF_10395 [Thomasclavelia ramosa]